MRDDFRHRVYEIVRQIPSGKVSTYRDVAHALGSRAYRAVGQALRQNRDPRVPCHRVVAADGNLGGFNRGVKEKERLLKKEGISVSSGKVQGFEKVAIKPRADY